MSSGKLRDASSKLRRISAPLKPRPSMEMPGSSFKLAKATRKRRTSSSAARADEATARIASRKCRRVLLKPGARLHSAKPAPATLPNGFDIDEGTGGAHRLRNCHREKEARAFAARR